MNRSANTNIEFLDFSDLSDDDIENWQRIANQSLISSPFIDNNWISSWIKAFAPSHPIIICGRQNGALVGVAPVQTISENWAGIRIKMLKSLTNAWSYRFEFSAVAEKADILAVIWKEIFKSKSWNVVHLEIVPDGSKTMDTGIGMAKKMGWTSLALPIYQSPWRQIGTNESDWHADLKNKFKSNLRNRERKISSLGEVEFKVYKNGEEIRKAIKIFYDLENSGWKREKGTSILEHKQAKILFDSLLTKASGEIWIAILFLSGKPIAADMIQIKNDTVFLLKVAYDPDFSRFSPGQLITWRILQYFNEQGMKTFDFLGENMVWKSDWTPELRQNYQLLFFSPSFRGRYAYMARYGLKKIAKKILKSG